MTDDDAPAEASAEATQATSTLPALAVLVHNERIKYTATWLNTLAAGAIIAGSVAPFVTLLAGGASGWVLLGSMIWIPIGVALHYFVLRLLSRLREG